MKIDPTLQAKIHRWWVLAVVLVILLPLVPFPCLADAARWFADTIDKSKEWKWPYRLTDKAEAFAASRGVKL